MATILSYLDIDLSISPETIVALIVILAANALAVGVAVIASAHDRRVKVRG